MLTIRHTKKGRTLKALEWFIMTLLNTQSTSVYFPSGVVTGKRLMLSLFFYNGRPSWCDQLNLTNHFTNDQVSQFIQKIETEENERVCCITLHH